MIEFLIYYKAIIQLWFASRQADKAYRGEYKLGRNKDGSIRYARPNVRYYVMPDENDKLICMNRRDFHKLRSKMRMGQDVLVKHLTKECFYFTPHANWVAPISDNLKRIKRQQYVDYCIALYHKKKETKKRNKAYVKQIKRDLYASKNKPRMNFDKNY